jgi:gliding motility-associated-like protein/uncharacterized repeat protein (TIGR01451 family)
LNPGAQEQVTLSRNITQSDINAGEYTLNAIASGLDPDSAPVSDNDEATVTATQTAALTVTNVPNPTTYSVVGDVINFVITVRNSGNVTLTNVNVTVPSGVSVTSGSANMGTLNPGAQEQVTLSRNITQSDINAGEYTLNAIASGLDPDSAPVSDNDEATVTATQTAALTVTNVPNPTTYSVVGDVINFVITVRNSGNVTLTNVNVTVPSGVSVTSGSANMGTLNPGAQEQVTLSRNITQSDINAGEYTLNAIASGLDPDSAPVSDNDEQTVTALKIAKLEVGITATPGTYSEPGQTINYTIIVRNTGNVTINSILVSVPDITILPGAGNLGTIEPGDFKQFEGTYTITQADIDAENFSVTATANGKDPDDETVTDSDTETIDAIIDSRITLGITAEPMTYNTAGDVITFTFTVTNPGNVTLNSVTLSVAGVNLSGGGNLGTLAPDEVRPVLGTRSMTQTDIDNGSFTASATVTGQGPTGEVSDAKSLEVNAIQNPDLSLSIQSSQDTYDFEDQVEFTFTIINEGNVLLSSLVLDVPGITFTDNVNDIGNLAPGGTRDVVGKRIMNQNDIDNGSFTASAKVTGLAPDGATVEAEDDITLNAILRSGLSVGITANPTTFSSTGITINFSITITNTGNTTINSIGLIVSGMNLSAGAENVGTLLPGASKLVSGSRVTTQADLDNGSITGSATANGTTVLGSPVSGSGSRVVNAIQNRSLLVEKTANVATYNAVGEEITYTVILRNNGNVTISNITVSDPLTGLQTNIASLAPGGSQTFNNLKYTVAQSDIDNGSITNIASASGTAPGSIVVSASRELIINVASQFPALGVTKTSNTNTYSSVGTQISYTIEVLNLGNVTLSSITINDPLTGFQQSVPSLAPGNKVSYNTNYTVNQLDLDNSSISNTVTVQAQDPDGKTLSEQATLVVNAIQSPGLFLDKTLVSINGKDETLRFDAEGDELVFSITVENTGNVTIKELNVYDSLTGLSETIVELAPGEIKFFADSYVVTLADLDAGSVINTVVASGKSPTGESIETESVITVNAIQRARLEIGKTLVSVNGNPDLKNFFVAGDQLVFEALVQNTGNVSLINLVVEDKLADFVQNIDRINPGVNLPVLIPYTATQANVNKGDITNTVTVVGYAPNNNELRASDVLTVNAIQDVGLRVEIFVSAINGNPSLTRYTLPDDEITFTIRVTNNGNVTIRNIQIQDELTGFEVSLETLEPGSNQTYTANYIITPADISNASISSVSTASGTDPGNESIEASDDVTVMANLISGLALKKTRVAVNGDTNLERYFGVGDVITYSIVVENSGNLPITQLEVLDPLTGVNDTRDTLAPFQVLNYSTAYTINQNDINNGSVVNVAVASGLKVDGDEIFAISNVTVQAARDAEISIVKSSNTSYFTEAGEVIEYSLFIQNLGNVALTNVAVEDPLTGFTQDIGTLTPGSSRTYTTEYTITANDVENGIIRNTARVTGMDPQGFTIEDESTIDVIIITDEVPEIVITKSSSPEGMADAGEDLTFFITVTNSSDILPALNISVSDPLAIGLTFLNADQSGQFQDGVVRWNIAQLDPGESIQFKLDVMVNTDVAGGTIISNKAIVQIQQIILAESNTVSLVINSKANLSITKDVDNFIPEIGDEVLFSITVGNQGPAVGAGVSVRDRLPSGFSYILDNSLGRYNPTTGVWQIGNLAVDETQTLEIYATVNPSGVFTNIAVLSAENFIPEGGNDTAMVVVTPNIRLIIPEGFSPNNDGINDYFVIKGIESYPQNSLIIMNRWGNRVFEVNGYNNNWDGSNQFGGSLGSKNLPEGTYFYILDLGQPGPGGQQVFKGYIYLAR